MSIDTEDLHLQLTDGDRQSATWQKLLRYFTAQRASCRAKNDGDLDPTETAGMRARIAVYTGLIALDEDRVPYDK